MLKHLLAFVLLAFLSGVTLADEARLLRIDAVVLILAADNPDIGLEERQAKLEEAYRKLIEIEQYFPSANSEIQLYRYGAIVRLSPGDVLKEAGSIRLGRLEVGKLRSVLGRKLSPDAVDENGWTDLHFAAALNLTELASVLLDLGARVDAELVAFEHCVYVSSRLKETLASLSLDDCYGPHSQPLHIAARENAFEVAAVLIDHGADLNAEGESGKTSLHFAAAINASEVAATLIDRGADVNARQWGQRTGRTPLHIAAGAGRTPLHIAAANNASEVAAVLIDRGANVNAKGRDGNTPLHIAAANNASEVAATLIDRGADVHAVGRNDKTPLHLAVEVNAFEVAAVLIERGADVNAKSPYGSPLRRAIRYGSQETEELLRWHNAHE